MATRHSKNSHSAPGHSAGRRKSHAEKNETAYEVERLSRKTAAPQDEGYYDEPDGNAAPTRHSRRGSEKKASYREDYREDRAAGGSGVSGGLVALLAFLGVLALVAAVFALLTLFGGKSAKTETPEATPTALAETTPDPAGEQTPAEPADETLTGTEETPAPPEPEAVIVKKDENGALIPGGTNAVVPQRDTQLALDSFATTTFIGNSFVEGMQLWSDIDMCEYVCKDGVALDNMIGNYLYFVTVRDYSAIYLTLGLNEIGWPVDSFISQYEKVIDYIRSDAYSKDATIYITSVMPAEAIMETTKSESGSEIHLSTILEFNERLREMCARKGCWYMDVYSELADETGYLPDDIAADDHVHFEKTGYRIWTDYLRSHYVDESLVEAN